MSTARNLIVYEDWTFSDNAILEGSVYLAASLLFDSLEASTFQATIVCYDKKILNFERNTPLTYYSRGWKIGIFYVQNIVRTGPVTYEISATSAIGLLINGLHYGGVYQGETLQSLVADICGSVPHVVKTDLREIALYGWLPVASPRDNLAQVLFAAGATVKTDLNGVLHIENLWDEVSREFPSDRMYRGPSVDYASKVTQVVVTEHQYAEGGEETSLFDGTAQQGDRITFSDPMYALQADGFQILDSGANYAVISAGTGTLTGRKYVHRTRQISRIVSSANEPNVKTVSDATLVSVLNSSAVADRIASYYACIESIHADAVYHREIPGDVTEAWHPYDSLTVKACLENAEISLSNTLKASETLLVGYIPPQNDQTVIYDQKEILSGSGIWTVPDGVYSVHVVLIGGGGPGEKGQDGASQISPEDDQTSSDYQDLTAGSTSETVNASSSASGAAMSAGDGGDGGASGVPGYVLETDLSVVPGTSIAFSCGAPGQISGQTGQSTSFGNLQSSSGGVLSGGYVDITTGIVYAAAGEPGVAGANGGSGGQEGGSIAGVLGGSGLAADSGNDSRSGQTDYGDYVLSGNFSGSWSYSAMGGGGAGGGTDDNPGSPGGNAIKTADGVIDFDTIAAAAYAPQVSPGSGGNGAPGKNAVTYGSAGCGGHGGGGAGSIGTRSARASATISAQLTGEKWGIPSISVTVVAQAPSSTASGGVGGEGGDGMEGCIILYYGTQSVVSSGALMEKNGQIFLDKYARYFVV